MTDGLDEDFLRIALGRRTLRLHDICHIYSVLYGQSMLHWVIYGMMCVTCKAIHYP